MKLKRLVTICLSAFVFSTITILVMGLWVVPQDSKNKTAGEAQPSPATNQQTAADNNPTPSPATPAPTNTTQSPAPSNGSTNSTTQPKSGGSTSNNKSSTPSSGGGSSSSGGGTSTPSPSQPACGSPGGTCSAAQVASHNSQGNCWVIYNGSYYIVTSYVNQHPGGTSVFNSSTCGHDITGYLNGSQSTAGQRKNHPGSAYTILNSYKVGPVQ